MVIHNLEKSVYGGLICGSNSFDVRDKSAQLYCLFQQYAFCPQFYLPSQTAIVFSLLDVQLTHSLP